MLLVSNVREINQRSIVCRDIERDIYAYNFHKECERVGFLNLRNRINIIGFTQFYLSWPTM